jgi:putative oxidoreductase
MDFGLLVIRVVIGLLLIGHGTQKLFGWFGGGGLAPTSSYFRSLGYWPPRTMAGMAGGAELFAGLSLALGLVTPLAAAALIGLMLNVAVAAHRGNGLWAAANGYEYPLVLATAATAIAFTGPGAVSLDARLGIADPALESALFAVGLGLAAGAALLVSRAAARSVGEPAAEKTAENTVEKLAA